LFCDNVTLKYFSENVTDVRWKGDIINDLRRKKQVVYCPFPNW